MMKLQFYNIKTIVDDIGSFQDKVDYEKFYKKELHRILTSSDEELIERFGIEDMIRNRVHKIVEGDDDFIRQQYLIEIKTLALQQTSAEKLWFDNHNPCYKVTSKVMQQIQKFEIGNLNEFNLPFQSFMLIFPKQDKLAYSDAFSENYNERGAIIKGMMINRLVTVKQENGKEKTYGSIISDETTPEGEIVADRIVFILYIYSPTMRDQVPILYMYEICKSGESIYKKIMEDQNMAEEVKTVCINAIKIALVAANEILLDEPVFVSKRSTGSL